MASIRETIVIKVDDRGVVSGYERISSESGKTAKRIEEDNDKSGKSFDDVEKSTGKFKNALGMVAGAVGLGSVAFGIKDVVQAGMQWQTQMTSLNVSLKNAGINSKGLATAMGKTAEASSTKGGFAASEQLAGIQQFISETHNATKAQQLNTDAMNLARGAHLSYTAAEKMVAMATTGSTGRLGKLVGPLIAVTKYTAGWTAAMKLANPQGYLAAQMQNKLATAAMVTAKIQKQYGGQMAAYSHTAAGAISDAKNTIENSMRSMGTAIMPVIAKLAQWFAVFLPKAIHATVAVIKDVVSWIRQNALVAKILAVGIGLVAAGWAAYTIAQNVATAATTLFNLVMDANPIGIVIIALTALTAGIVYAYKHSASFRLLLQEVWQSMKEIGKWISTTFHNIWHGLGDAIHTALEPLLAMYNMAKKVISLGSSIGHGIAHAVSSVFHGGGVVEHHATGGVIGGVSGLVGGTGSGDTVPSMLEPHEYVLRKQAVNQIGVGNLNAMNAGGSIPPSGGGTGAIPVSVTIPIKLDSRILAESNYRFILRKQAQTGRWAA